MALHYGAGLGLPTTGPTGNGFPNDPAFELEYTPFGVDSGLCVGVATTAVQNERRHPAAVWRLVQDRLDRGHQRLAATLNRGYVPLINGSDTNFSHPFVLTYPANGYPTDKPRPQLISPEPDRVLATASAPVDRHRQRQPALGR